MTQPYGFTHGAYLDTLVMQYVHVYTPDSLIVREVWRRYRCYPMLAQLDRTTVKGMIRDLLERHHQDQAICRAFDL